MFWVKWWSGVIVLTGLLLGTYIFLACVLLQSVPQVGTISEIQGVYDDTEAFPWNKDPNEDYTVWLDWGDGSRLEGWDLMLAESMEEADPWMYPASDW